jgi:hypothetical protein
LFCYEVGFVECVGEREREISWGQGVDLDGD